MESWPGARDSKLSAKPRYQEEEEALFIISRSCSSVVTELMVEAMVQGSRVGKLEAGGWQCGFETRWWGCRDWRGGVEVSGAGRGEGSRYIGGVNQETFKRGGRVRERLTLNWRLKTEARVAILLSVLSGKPWLKSCGPGPPLPTWTWRPYTVQSQHYLLN